MKKFSILALALVLTAALFTGCGCRNNVAPTPVPTTMPTTQPTVAPTHETTLPATEHLNPSTDATIDHGNGPLEETTHGANGTNGTTATEGVAEGRARSHVPAGR